MTRRSLFATIAAAIAGPKLVPVIAPVVALPRTYTDFFLHSMLPAMDELIWKPWPGEGRRYGVSIQIPWAMLENDELHLLARKASNPPAATPTSSTRPPR